MSNLNFEASSSTTYKHEYKTNLYMHVCDNSQIKVQE